MMEMKKLLIADGSEDFCRALQEQVQNHFQIRHCTGGKEALARLREFHPDILVLDMMLPELDGISLLQGSASLGLHPLVLATTGFLNDYILTALEQLHVDYLMVKPCDAQATAARILDLSQRLSSMEVSETDPYSAVSDLLLSMSVPTKRKGFPFLREAILLLARDPGMSITKELYPAVARACGGTASQVERSIRSAIESAWELRDEALWQEYFPTAPGQISWRPTNAAFISRLADRLRR